MENRSHIVAAVIFILVFGGGVVGFFFWLSTGNNADRTVVIETEQAVGGLSSQSPVKFKGLKVGHMVSVGFDPHDANKIRLVFQVGASVPLNHSSYAELATQGITGLSTLNLKTPKPTAAPLEGHPTRLKLRQGLLGKLESRGRADLDKISAILDQVQKLTGGDNAKHISQTLAQLDQATRRLAQAQKSLQPTLAQLPGLTRQLRQTAASINKATQQAGQSSQDVMRSLNNQLLPHIDALTRQMDDAARQIKDLGSELSNKPQSVLSGPPKRRPGPGESGFKPDDH